MTDHYFLLGNLQVGLGWNFGSLETTSKPSGENYLEDEDIKVEVNTLDSGHEEV